jgi:hypothetical protein
MLLLFCAADAEPPCAHPLGPARRPTRAADALSRLFAHKLQKLDSIFESVTFNTPGRFVRLMLCAAALRPFCADAGELMLFHDAAALARNQGERDGGLHVGAEQGGEARSPIHRPPAECCHLSLTSIMRRRWKEKAGYHPPFLPLAHYQSSS